MNRESTPRLLCVGILMSFIIICLHQFCPGRSLWTAPRTS